MTNSMVERVAKAIHSAGRLDTPETDEVTWREASENEKIVAGLQARAAIEALRVPTTQMLLMGEHEYDKASCGLLDTDVGPLHNAWDTMIDEALK